MKVAQLSYTLDACHDVFVFIQRHIKCDIFGQQGKNLITSPFPRSLLLLLLPPLANTPSPPSGLTPTRENTLWRHGTARGLLVNI
jgi:hypothetical protein